MSIVESEIILRTSVVITDTSANGGRMAKYAVTSGVKNALFPDFSMAERAAGLTRYRKFFVHIANDDDLALQDAQIYLTNPTPAGDAITMFVGTHADTQADIATPTEYGTGALTSDAAAGGTSLGATIEDPGLELFREGDTIRIADGANEEFHVLGSVSQVGANVTLGLATGSMLANAYAAANTVVSSVLAAGDVETALDLDNVISSAGTFDEGQIVLDNIGTVTHQVTLTFTSATAFSAVSDVLGSLGTGNISSVFAPVNSDYSKPYCTISTAAWGGTWEAGDIVRFTSTAAAFPVWLKCVCPAGAASASDNTYGIGIRGGSA